MKVSDTDNLHNTTFFIYFIIIQEWQERGKSVSNENVGNIFSNLIWNVKSVSKVIKLEWEKASIVSEINGNFSLSFEIICIQ